VIIPFTFAIMANAHQASPGYIDWSSPAAALQFIKGYMMKQFLADHNQQISKPT